MPDNGKDDGLFGPDSVTWKVVAHPGTIIGGLRALLVQSFHPLALAGVVQHSDYLERPLDRLKRTAYYVAATCFGDTATAQAAAAHVKKLHRKVRGVDPVTNQPYSAEDPDTQLWVHCVEVHSYLAAYRVFGDGLTPQEEDRYLAESAQRAALLDVPPERVPSSVAQMREYWAGVRSQLVVSDDTRATIRFVTRPPLTRDLAAVYPGLLVLANAAVAITPSDLRRLAGIDRSRARDAAAIAAARPLVLSLKLPGIRNVQGYLYGGRTRELALRAQQRFDEHGRPRSQSPGGPVAAA
jgi:uncharacterized protein (DUF2236 family)